MTETKARPLAKHPPPSGCVLIPNVQIAVTIPGTPPALVGLNGRAHWAVKARETKRLRQDAYLATLAVVNDARTDEPFPPDARLAVSVIIGWEPGRKRVDEVDNLPSLLKATLDGFADALGRSDARFTPAGIDQVRDSEGLGWVRIQAEVIQSAAEDAR